MRNALSIPAGAWSETRVPKKLLTSRLTLIRPRLIVTGSIRISTRRTSAFASASRMRTRNGASSARLMPNGVLRRS